MNIGTHLLGRRVEHDPASRNFPSPHRKIVSKKNVIWINQAPILDQGNLGSCVGNSAAEWLNCGATVKNRRVGKLTGRRSPTAYLNEVDAVNIYARATQFDEWTDQQYPPEDCGTSGLGAAKALQFYGFITAYQHTFTFESFLATLQAQPVMIGINWYDSFMATWPDGHIRLGAKDTDPVGGHEVLVRGIDWAQQRIQCRNHWTKKWGRNGDFYISFDLIERLLKEDGDVLAPVVMV